MPTSEARIQANRLNAQKSSGPKSEAGKAASRANSYKHGMTGAGVVASAGEAAAVAELSVSLHEEMRPASSLGSILVGRIAAMAVRMDRCGRWDLAATAQRVRNAGADFEDRRADEADAAFARLFDEPGSVDPGPILRKLKRTTEGLTRLIEGWADLAEAVQRPDLAPWSDRHLRNFEALAGRRPTEIVPSRASVLARVLGGDLSGLPSAEAAPLAKLGPEGRASWARDRLFAMISAEVESLKSAYHGFDHEAIRLDRAEAPDRALFDPSREATLARKYEAAAERGFYRALQEFEQAEAEAMMVEPSPGSGSPPESAGRGSLASFFPRDVTPPNRKAAPPQAPRTGSFGPTEARPEPVEASFPEQGSGGSR